VHFNVITFLGEGLEEVGLHYDRFITQVLGTSVDYWAISMFGRENIQVLLGVDRVSCEGEEWGCIEGSRIDKV